MANERPDPSQLSEKEHEHLLKMIAESSVSAAELKDIPDQYKNFFTLALGSVRKKSASGKMSLVGKARPEEIEALNKANIPLDEVPEDVSRFLQSQGFHTSEESQLAAMSEHNLDIETLKGVSLENATEAQKREFDEMLSRWNQENITIIDSAAKSSPTAKLAPTPAARKVEPTLPPPVPPAPPPAKKTAAINQDFFSQVAQTAKVAPPPAPPPPAAEEKKEVAPAIEAVAHICKKCSWNNQQEYPAQPTKSDIDNRLISIASTVQGGDGRFRKEYSLFEGTIKVRFRELTTEGNTIYNCEQSRVMTFANEAATTAAQWFSLNRIQLRRFHCGLEAVERPGFTIEIPPLEHWIQRHDGDAEAALTELTDYVQNVALPIESLKLSVSNLWLEFEDLVQKLWRDQSFYKGSR